MAVYKLDRIGNQIRFVSPYNPDFITLAKEYFRAKWDGGCWCFDACDETRVLALIDRQYGWADGMELVSVSLKFHETRHYSCSPCVLLGRVLVAATSRDSGARVGDGVRLVAGKGASSGGSVKNWTTDVAEGSEFLIHDVPLKMAQEYISGNRSVRSVSFSLASAPGASQKQVKPKTPLDGFLTLRTERDKLISKIFEIESGIEKHCANHSMNVTAFVATFAGKTKSSTCNIVIHVAEGEDVWVVARGKAMEWGVELLGVCDLHCREIGPSSVRY